MEKLMVCPSGLTGVIRGLRGIEAQALSEPATIRSGSSTLMMLRNCWTETTEPGPYKPDASGKLDWKKILMGDRMVALVEMRSLTWGDDYEFDVQCRACKKQYPWEVNLSDLDRRILPDASREKIAGGENAFTASVMGAEVTFRLPTGVEEDRINKARNMNKGHVSIIDALAVQTIDIQGVPPTDSAWRQFYEAAELMTLRDILDEFQVPDCGLETSFETQCTWCEWMQEIQLPFEAAFFYPKKKKAKPGAQTETRTTTGSLNDFDSPDAKV